MTASHSLTVQRLQHRWKMHCRIAAVQRRKAFITAHAAAACPTYTSLLSQRHHLARQICDLAEQPQTRLQLRSTTAGSPLDGAQYTFGVEVDGVSAGRAEVGRDLQPRQRLEVAAWRNRAVRHGRASRREPGDAQIMDLLQAARSGLASLLRSPSTKRFALGGRSAASGHETLAEDAERPADA